MSRADFEHYFSVLKGEERPILEAKPECGFWKRRFVKGGPWVAAAIWKDPATGELLCRVGPKMEDPEKHWLSLADYPVAEADARYYFEHGHWPGQEAAPAAEPKPEIAFYKEAESVEELVEFLADPAAAVEKAAAFTADGQANPNDAGQSDYDKHRAAVDDALEGAKIWEAPDAKILDALHANVVEAKINKLRELISAGKKMHETEKAPHLKAGQEVDKKYNPDIKKMDAARALLLSKQTVWLNAQAAKIEEAKAAAVEAGNDDDEAPPFEVQPIKTAGYSGKAIGLKDHTVVEIGDMAKAAKAILADTECKAELEEIIAKLAKRMLTAGKKVTTAKLVVEKIAA